MSEGTSMMIGMFVIASGLLGMLVIEVLIDRYINRKEKDK